MNNQHVRSNVKHFVNILCGEIMKPKLATLGQSLVKSKQQHYLGNILMNTTMMIMLSMDLMCTHPLLCFKVQKTFRRYLTYIGKKIDKFKGIGVKYKQDVNS